MSGGQIDSEKARRVAENFALMLETACEEFECLQRMLRGEIRLTAYDEVVKLRAPMTIQLALAKSFLFNVVRAHRICKQGKSTLLIERALRKNFIQALEPIVAVRGVNEHGFDVQTSSGQEPDRPTAHIHADISMSVDETAIGIEGPERIIMGPLNLFDVYTLVARMRGVAGFAALARNSAITTSA